MNKEQLERKILPLVKKPVTYQGNEIGSVHKELTADTIRFAFAFPDVYEVGMSHLGLKILYALLNDQKDIACERVFAPWPDMEEQLRTRNLPLFALESADPLMDFDMVGFTLQYEMSFTNILNMLDLAGIPLRSEERGEDAPIILAGGPCACNPEPLADFIDLFVIGEGEEVILDLLKCYRQNRDDRQCFFKEAAQIQGIYVPSLCTQAEDGRLIWKESGEPVQIKKCFIKDIEKVYFPEQVIVPFTETIHDRVTAEIFRGCGRGCRFCQAGMIYRPVREKSLDCIESDIQKILENTGYEEIALSSLSSGDYTQIETLIHDLVERYQEKRIGVSLPSLRIDSLSIDMLEEIQKIRKSGITLAPEAGTQRMRDVINKGVTEEDLMGTVSNAFQKGWGHIKLYFMMGLPTETTEDVTGIADLAEKVLEQYYAVDKDQRNKAVKIVLSSSCFVPKPHTPFQWMGQETQGTFREKQQLLKDAIKSRKIQYNWHDAATSYYEAIFARGDRKLGEVLYNAYQLGCKFDGWHEYFSEEKWQQAFAQAGIDGDDYALRTRDFGEVLPWDFIDMGVTKDFLRREWDKAMAESLTTDCRSGCGGCGIQSFEKGWQCHGNHEI
ncbi:MAG: TIGR03960 family B12-binding radical SAM protein [Eubacterium aggregans]|uniref:TIGR03960 family B12-binding radical SAM protein n=1 Tax=Eubacterium aggregans TaxID=81409 RepID=UPI002B1F4FFC|nr:TIGR03960 family B12-binding radical SAM protein [Eubacterium aggregans]MEA5074064.1 TIGR03960 family B12-binding radical SAM protein [Eubacterium aggregans]